MKKCTIFGGVLLLVSLIMLGASFDKVSPVQMAVSISSLSPDYAKADLITSGLHYKGLFQKYIKYPADLIFLEFPSLSVATVGGQQMKLNIAFQVRLMTSDLITLASRYQENYKPKFQNVAETTIKNYVSKRYSTDDYFENRQTIAKALQLALNLALREQYCIVEGLQLMGITAPDAIDKKILDKLLEEQKVRKTEELSAAILVRAETESIQGQYIAEANVAKSNAASKAKIIEETAKANAVEVRLDARSQAYQILQTELGYNNQELLKWMFIEQVRNLDGDSQVAVNIDKGLLQLNK